VTGATRGELGRVIVIERQIREIFQAWRIREVMNRKHVRALLQFLDPAHPRDQTVTVDANGHGGKDRHFGALAGDHARDGTTLLQFAPVFGAQRDRGLKKRKRITCG
jgi:hypothetical protein